MAHRRLLGLVKRLRHPTRYRAACQGALNIAVGRDRFQELLGFPPAAFKAHRDEFDYAALDRVLPHPVYAPQGWIAIVCPAERTSAQARRLLSDAHHRAASG